MTILPSAIRGHGYRQEAIDLQPGGATISVTVPSDNPYEMGDDVEIVTQMSGGMAGPDPKMRSKRVAAKGVRRVRPAQRIHAGFLPGMGADDDLSDGDLEGDEIEVGLFGTVRKPRGNPKARRVARPKQYLVQANRVHAGFLPGMGTDPNDDLDGFGAEVVAGKRQKVIPMFRPSPAVLARGKALFAPRTDQVAGLGAGEVPFYLRPAEGSAPAPTNASSAPAKEQSTSATDVLKTIFSGAAQATEGIAKSAASVAEARRSGGPASVTYTTNVAAPSTREEKSKLPWIVTGVGALVAVGALAYFLTRKKA
jgi:hypothetical protein